MSLPRLLSNQAQIRDSKWFFNEALTFQPAGEDHHEEAEQGSNRCGRQLPSNIGVPFSVSQIPPWMRIGSLPDPQ